MGRFERAGARQLQRLVGLRALRPHLRGWEEGVVLAIEITVDDKRRVVAPVSGMGLMIASIHAGNRLAEQPRRGKPKVLEDYLELNVGGVTETEHQNWVSMLPLEVGAEVVMRIVDVDRADPPVERSARTDPE